MEQMALEFYEPMAQDKRERPEDNGLYAALIASVRSNFLELSFAKMFGKKAEIVQGDRRFECRRVGKTTYLLIDRREEERRAANVNSH